MLIRQLRWASGWISSPYPCVFNHYTAAFKINKMHHNPTTTMGSSSHNADIDKTCTAGVHHGCGGSWAAEAAWMYCRILWNAVGDGLWPRNDHSAHGQQLWWTFLQSPGQLHVHRTCHICGITPGREMHIWERLFIVAHLCQNPAASGSATPVSRVYHLLTNTDLDRLAN